MTTPSTIDKQALRNEMELTRRAFHELVMSIPPDAWNKKSGNPEMTIKQLLWHTAWAMTWQANSIDEIRQGKSRSLPSFIIEPGRKLAMRWLARDATPGKTTQKYDEGHALIVTRLEETPVEAWEASAERFGETRTVGWVFGNVKEHFEEHARDVRAALEA